MDSENIQNNDNVDGKSIRLLRPSIVVLCGPAACGKSTFAEKHFRPTQIISSDWARARVCDDDRDQRFNAQAFALVHFLVDQRLMLNRLCVVDSTALTVQARRELLELARKYQVPTSVLCFNIPLETCLERDEKRERTVGRAIIERQYQAFEQTKTLIDREGFDQVVEFQPDDIDKVQIEILFRPAARAPQRPPRGDDVGRRRFERPPQFSRPRPTALGGNGHLRAAANVPEAAPDVAAPQPAAASPTAGAAPQLAKAPAVDLAPKPASVLRTNESSPPANRTTVPTPSAASRRVARPTAARPVPVSASSPGSG